MDYERRNRQPHENTFYIEQCSDLLWFLHENSKIEAVDYYGGYYDPHSRLQHQEQLNNVSGNDIYHDTNEDIQHPHIDILFSKEYQYHLYLTRFNEYPLYNFTTTKFSYLTHRNTSSNPTFAQNILLKCRPYDRSCMSPIHHYENSFEHLLNNSEYSFEFTCKNNWFKFDQCSNPEEFSVYAFASDRTTIGLLPKQSYQQVIEFLFESMTDAT